MTEIQWCCHSLRGSGVHKDATVLPVLGLDPETPSASLVGLHSLLCWRMGSPYLYVTISVLPRVETSDKKDARTTATGRRTKDEKWDGGRGGRPRRRKQLCEREAQLGNEKCTPSLSITPPYSARIHTDTIRGSLSSPQERWVYRWGWRAERGWRRDR